MNTDNLEVMRVEIAKLELREGDILVIKLNDMDLVEQSREFVDKFHEMFDIKIGLVFLPSGADFSVVRKID